jgi:hypothetical protein
VATSLKIIEMSHFNEKHVVGLLEAIVHGLLAYSMKAKWTNFCTPPIKLLESFVCSIDGHSVKCPLLTPKGLW